MPTATPKRTGSGAKKPTETTYNCVRTPNVLETLNSMAASKRPESKESRELEDAEAERSARAFSGLRSSHVPSIVLAFVEGS